MSSEAVPVAPVTCQVLESSWSGLRDLHVACTVKRFTRRPWVPQPRDVRFQDVTHVIKVSFFC